MNNCLGKQAEINYQIEREATTTLTISHKGLVDTSLHSSRKTARAALREYVKDWWATDAGEDTPIPKVTYEAIKAYFTEHAPGTYEIAARTIALTIIHEYGADSFAHKSRKSAEAALLAYVKEWWTREAGEAVPMPEDPTAAIEAYFMEHATGENYVIAPLVAPRAHPEASEDAES